MAEITDEQRKMIDELATSMSRLCHRVIAKRLEQFFEVIGDELQKRPTPVVMGPKGFVPTVGEES